jgi:quinol monooxygenase YgiN
MFGTVARIQVKPGQVDAVVRHWETWNRERRPQVAGAVAGYLFKLEGKPNELIGVAVFTDRESYFASAKDPAQDRWYRGLRALLVVDPEWNDGEIVGSS